MTDRLVPVLCLVLAACGPEVSARDVADDHAGSPPAPPAAAPTSTDGHAPLVAAAPATIAEEPFPVDALPAVLFSDLDAEVGARMDGVIRSVGVELGDAVEHGQVLAVLDDAREVARVASVSAAVDLARAEHTRSEGLHASGFVTPAQFEEALYRLRAAEAALREAQIELEHTRVTAPFNGVVTRRVAGRGHTVREGDPLFRITALQPLRALARVPERAARDVRPGAAAAIIADGGIRVDATVTRISPAVDPASGTVEVLFSVPRPGLLRPGSGAVIQFIRPAREDR